MLNVGVWARRAVRRRLGVLHRQLLRLERTPTADAIHDVRVASRRLRAALRLFQVNFPPGEVRRLRAAVRRVTQLLGAARDLDVFAQNLTRHSVQRGSSLVALVARLQALRMQKLERAIPQARQLRHHLLAFPVGGANPGRALQPAESVSSNFQRILPQLLRRYFQRGRRVVLARAANKKLHRFRIRTKWMRYKTELYAEVFPGALRSALPCFRRIQDLLGRLQDQCMLQLFFKRRMRVLRDPPRRAECQRVVKWSRARQKRLRRAFFCFWERLEENELESRLLARIAATRVHRPRRSRRRRRGHLAGVTGGSEPAPDVTRAVNRPRGI